MNYVKLSVHVLRVRGVKEPNEINLSLPLTIDVN
jgi:hypothetical protein